MFCWIRNLDTLVPFSTIANLCIFFGLAVILYYVFYLFVEKKAKVFDEPGVVAVKISGTALPFFFGNALYSYEGIGMVMLMHVCMCVCVHARVYAHACVCMLYMCVLYMCCNFYYIHADTSIRKQNEDTKALP